ncbi:NAD-dependent epimerase/dehydratase family protein [Rickettsiales endosymbiont of Stachyamoeba lipophora]|uniref:NAD-dependent epimerase/dehydratase family protein n=1 Tax=Rickettsiales endosymbiont of Stachyamoeba lipophora TaxID=2486578 RepID=UPI000F64A94A|nr:NAD-dependent epimerase/dehydratase family protein [Rickettsiales endosymbiont of Stachyamoeba lipophora]AZL15028.1 NAD-dependent epimerase/dehydratase family protein [Rickettsiales endosymbiont of Stachyamoeba lipophora]
MNKIIFFGFGYAAKHIAAYLNPKEFEIIHTSRSLHSSFSFNYPDTIADIDFTNITHIIISIPPINNMDAVYEAYLQKIINNAPNLRFIGYISSTGVYGNHDGKVVNEESELKALKTSSAYRRIKIEQDWLQLEQLKPGLAVNIFRIAGIYGPWRSAFEGINNKSFILQTDQAFSRIHVEDLAQAIVNAIQFNLATQIFNIADDMPASITVIHLYAYQLLSLPSPKIVDYTQANLSPMMQEFLNQNKIVSNQKIKDILQLQLKYPNYKEGLKSIFEQHLYDPN